MKRPVQRMPEHLARAIEAAGGKVPKPKRAKQRSIAAIIGAPAVVGGLHSIRFDVPGPPLPWERTKTASNGKRVTSKRQRSYQRLVRDCAWSALLPDGGPHRWSSMGRYAVDVVARVADYGTRDLDNIAKQVCDSLQGLLFANDSRVDDIHVKRVVDPSNQGLTVMVTMLVERWESGKARRA